VGSAVIAAHKAQLPIGSAGTRTASCSSYRRRYSASSTDLNHGPGASALHTRKPAAVPLGGNRAIEMRPGPAYSKKLAVFNARPYSIIKKDCAAQYC
jgi:hypothetical protein